MGSISPTRSATVTSGVGELFDVAVVGGEPSDGGGVAEEGDEVFGELREGGRRGCRGARSRRRRGCRWSRRVVRARRMRDLAWPRRPRRMKLCLERTALTIWGHDGVFVADDAGEEGPPSRRRQHWARRRAMRFSRSSSLTVRPRRSGVVLGVCGVRRAWLADLPGGSSPYV